MTVVADTDATKRDERRAISVASGAHALHDGYTDLIYVMLPIWQAEFALSYAAVGLKPQPRLRVFAAVLFRAFREAK